MGRTIDRETLQTFRQRLTLDERSPGTVKKYTRDAEGFGAWPRPGPPASRRHGPAVRGCKLGSLSEGAGWPKARLREFPVNGLPPSRLRRATSL